MADLHPFESGLRRKRGRSHTAERRPHLRVELIKVEADGAAPPKASQPVPKSSKPVEKSSKPAAKPSKPAAAKVAPAHPAGHLGQMGEKIQRRGDDAIPLAASFFVRFAIIPECPS